MVFSMKLNLPTIFSLKKKSNNLCHNCRFDQLFLEKKNILKIAPSVPAPTTRTTSTRRRSTRSCTRSG
jgi:hypothetical protein